MIPAACSKFPAAQTLLGSLSSTKAGASQGLQALAQTPACSMHFTTPILPETAQWRNLLWTFKTHCGVLSSSQAHRGSEGTQNGEKRVPKWGSFEKLNQIGPWGWCIQEWTPMGYPSPRTSFCIKLVRDSMPFACSCAAGCFTGSREESTAVTYAKEKNTLLDHVELMSPSLHS